MDIQKQIEEALNDDQLRYIGYLSKAKTASMEYLRMKIDEIISSHRILQSVIYQQFTEIERQREAIERVIAELERKRQVNIDFHDYSAVGAYETSIDMLQEVLEDGRSEKKETSGIQTTTEAAKETKTDE